MKPTLFYRVVRALFSFVLKLFFQVEAPVDPNGLLRGEGPVLYVGNHPNALVDPTLLFILIERQVTFLAKEPIFRMPVLGWLARGVGALPVFRKKDGADTAKNDETLNASIAALVQGRAITLFPEGKSHSEPQLAELKTGCARIALAAVRQGAPVRIVPVGLTYEAKHQFRSKVRVEVGAALTVQAFVEKTPDGERDAVLALTNAIADALRDVTLNLDKWEDLPIIETAEALYALVQKDEAGAPERQRAFAKGMQLLREEEPERFDALKTQVASLRRRLNLLEATPESLTYSYRPASVARFVVRNGVWVFGLPVVVAGLVAFFLPYWVPHFVTRAVKAEADMESTVKVGVTMLVAPLWWALLTGLAAWFGGAWVALAVLVLVPVVALFTRFYVERRAGAFRDARMFFSLISRTQLHHRLREEGLALAASIDEVAARLKPRVVKP